MSQFTIDIPVVTTVPITITFDAEALSEPVRAALNEKIKCIAGQLMHTIDGAGRVESKEVVVLTHAGKDALAAPEAEAASDDPLTPEERHNIKLIDDWAGEQKRAREATEADTQASTDDNDTRELAYAEPLPARAYLSNRHGAAVFVSEVETRKGKMFGTFHKAGGSFNQIRSEDMPLVETANVAQANLDAWAAKHKMVLVEPDVEVTVEDGVITNVEREPSEAAVTAEEQPAAEVAAEVATAEVATEPIEVAPEQAKDSAPVETLATPDGPLSSFIGKGDTFIRKPELRRKGMQYPPQKVVEVDIDQQRVKTDAGYTSFAALDEGYELHSRGTAQIAVVDGGLSEKPGKNGGTSKPAEPAEPGEAFNMFVDDPDADDAPALDPEAYEDDPNSDDAFATDDGNPPVDSSEVDAFATDDDTPTAPVETATESAEVLVTAPANGCIVPGTTKVRQMQSGKVYLVSAESEGDNIVLCDPEKGNRLMGITRVMLDSFFEILPSTA
jgi:hypothetical protein